MDNRSKNTVIVGQGTSTTIKGDKAAADVIKERDAAPVVEKMEFNPLEKPTIKTFVEKWFENLKADGKTGFWPSWLNGQYIRPESSFDDPGSRKAIKSRAARARMEAKKEYKPGTKKVVRRHGRNVLVDKPAAGTYFVEDNALEAIANVLKYNGTRQVRRALCFKLGLQWSEYKEAEAILYDAAAEGKDIGDM